MNKSDALRLLATGNSRERLEAARYLLGDARSDDLEILQAALARETDDWTRSTIKLALQRIRGQVFGSEWSEEPEPMDDLYAQATQEITGRIVHELEPVVGAVRYYAQKDIEHFPQSETARELERLRQLVQAIETLGLAASVPKWQDVELAHLLSELKQSIRDVEVKLAGQSPFVVVADPALLEVIVRNGLQNAAEATADAGAAKPIVINWNANDKESWVAILDEGVGLPRQSARVFDMGATTKPGHLGMGLATAARAAKSMRGKLDLKPREEGGTSFEFRWPRDGRTPEG